MTDNVLYLDEQGYPCDDTEIFTKQLTERQKCLLSMTKEERIEWFRESRYPYPINFRYGNRQYGLLPYRAFFNENRKGELARKKHSGSS